MTYFQKVVDDEGNESYVEVNLSEIELPEDHPLNAKLAAVTEESIERRKALKALKQQLAALEGSKDDGEKPETTTPKTEIDKPQVEVDPQEIARAAAELVLKQQQEAAQAEKQRATQIDNILKETGLSATFRPVLEAIPDIEVAKAQAKLLAQATLEFGDTPRGGNGQRDTASLLSKADLALGFGE